MRHPLLASLALVVGAFALVAHGAAKGDITLDPLLTPAATTRLATTTLLSGVARAGDRLVAVGIRGLIVTSDDHGATWQQRAAPVSSDLLAVQFPSAKRGWAVGHDGVVLHSADGGTTWRKQLDGRDAARLLIAHAEQLAAGGDAAAAHMLDDVRMNYQNGPEQALLDVWFDDDRHGFVCGSFGTLLATNDGGATWESWVDRIDSDGLVHLNAMRGIGGALFIASERGQVYRLDRDKRRFVASATGYDGSLFSIAGNGDVVIAGGLRGNAFRSADGGRSWSKLPAAGGATLTGADSSAGRVLMVDQSGRLLFSDDAGATFTSVRAPRASLLSGVVGLDAQTAVVVGAAGVQQIHLKPATH